MKRYEKMSKDEIMDTFDSRSNYYIQVCRKISEEIGCDGRECQECIYDYLHEEIETVPRCHKCNTVDDFMKMRYEWIQTNGKLSLDEYMMEGVEK